MAEPITWRNVIGPSLADAARPLQQAGDAMNNGFDRLMKTLEGAQQANQTVYDRGQENQLLGFKEALANAKTPADVAQIQSQRDTYLNGLDPKYRSQVVGAEDTRTAALQDTITARQKFDEGQFLQANQGTIAQVRALAAQGKVDEAQALAAPLIAHPIYGDLVKEAIAGKTAATAAEDAHLGAQSTRNYQLAEGNAATANAANGAVQAQTAQGTLALHQLDAVTKHQSELRDALAKESAGTISGPGGMDAALADIAKVITDKDRLATVTRLAMEAYNSAGPDVRRLPTSEFVSRILENSKDIGVQGWLPDLNVASRMATSLKAALADEGVKARMVASEASRNRILNDLQLTGPTLDEARGRVFPQTQAGIAGAIDRRAATAATGGVDLGRLTQVVMGAESGGRRFGMNGQLLTSDKGAKGEMQVTDPTNKNPGYGVTPAKDDSPAERARVGQDYLAAMVKEYKGDIGKAAAAYNAGPGAVDAAVKQYGNDWLAHVPAETQNYVDKVTKGYGATVIAAAKTDAPAPSPAAAPAAVAPSAAPAPAPSRTMDPVLPPPTQRFVNPPDSQAGKMERRNFEAQQQASVQAAQQDKANQAAVIKAQARAETLLKQGDPRALNDFQTTDTYRLLPQETQRQIWSVVNGRPAPKKVR
jgi:hypothetical protein